MNWSFRCAVSMSRPARVADVVFMKKWLQGLRAWLGVSLRGCRSRSWSCSRKPCVRVWRVPR